MLLWGALTVVIAIIFFSLYAQFALDYTLENLKDSLEAVQGQELSGLGTRAYHNTLENLAIEEMTRKDADFQSVMLLELAARSVRDAVDQFGSARAGLYLTEVLKEKSPQRSFLLQVLDTVIRFSRTFFRASQNLWKYFWNRVRRVPEAPTLEATGALILNEAERLERDWKLKEAERYYREFLDRYRDRPERGFVKIFLAQVLIKMRRLDEATVVLGQVQREFPGAREETTALTLLERARSIQRRLSRLGELENWVKSRPERLYLEEGGLELALSYLATYQLDRALSVLERLSEAKDPRVRSKALFYRGWINKWKGDPDEGKKIFEMLEKEPQVNPAMATAATVQIADIHYEKKEYKQALMQYEDLASKAASETWKALSELETSNIYLVGMNNVEAARGHLDRLQLLASTLPTGREIFRKKLEEALDIGLRDEAFGALRDGKVDVAFKKFEDYLRKFSRDGQAYSGMASISLLKGRLNEAFEEAEKGYALSRDEYTATVLGYVYEKMNKLKEAVGYYQIGTEIKPSYVPARFNLAWVYVRTARFLEADRLLESLEKEMSDLPKGTRAKVLNNRGCALWGLGKRQEAVVRFQKALKLMPELAEAKTNLNLAAGQKPVPAVI